VAERFTSLVGARKWPEICRGRRRAVANCCEQSTFIGGIGDKTANVQGAMGASFEVELSDTVSEPLTLTCSSLSLFLRFSVGLPVPARQVFDFFHFSSFDVRVLLPKIHELTILQVWYALCLYRQCRQSRQSRSRKAIETSSHERAKKKSHEAIEQTKFARLEDKHE
jgi:hypothetical protein